MELNGIHNHLVFDDDVNLLGKNVNNMKENMKYLLDANVKVSLEVRAKNTKYVSMSDNQTASRYHFITAANTSFIFLEMIIADQDFFRNIL
jgi:hypothetical protein